MRGEDSLQASIVAWIRLCAPQCICAAIPNGGRRDRREAAKLKATGVLAGMPDLLVLGPGRVVIGFECKTATGRVSAEQNAIAEHWRALGAVWAVVRSIDDVRHTLASVGVVTREVA